MQLTLGQHSDCKPTAVDGAWRRQLTPRLACSVFCGGVMVETLGIALLAALGWVLAGGAIAVCGLAIAVFADRRWPGPATGVSIAALARDYASMRRPTARRSTHTGGSR